MKDWLQVITYLAIMVALVAFVVWAAMFRYNECKMVGHSTTYCVLSGGK